MTTVNIDIDGVVYDFHKEMHEEIMATHTRVRGYIADDKGKYYPYLEHHAVRDSTPWEMWTRYGISQGTWNAIFRRGVEHGSLFSRGEPIHGAVDGLWTLYEEGVKVRLVTRRLVHSGLNAKILQQTAEWLDKWMVPYWTITFVGKRDDKIGFVGDVAIDDSPTHYDELVKHNKFVFIFDQPWNRHRTDAMRINDWDELLNTVLHLHEKIEMAN